VEHDRRCRCPRQDHTDLANCTETSSPTQKGQKKGSQRSIIPSAISASQCFSSILKTPLTGVNRSELNRTSCDRPPVPPVLTTVVDQFPVRELTVQVGGCGSIGATGIALRFRYRQALVVEITEVDYGYHYRKIRKYKYQLRKPFFLSASFQVRETGRQGATLWLGVADP